MEMNQIARESGSPASLIDRRADTVAAAVGRVRDIERRQGITQKTLENITSILIDLASRTELFPAEHFPLTPDGQSVIYHLSEDRDSRFALYASAGAPGKVQPPHNHTTWAVISGVFGEEHNVIYERTDNRKASGRGTLRKTDESTVRPGNACALLPDDFHTIEVTSDEPSLHLHMYGRSLEHLFERICFTGPEGGEYKTFPPNPNIRAPFVSANELKAMINDGHELALLDVREEGVNAKRHLLFACPLPLSRLELGIDALVPRRSTRIVLCDDDESLAQRAATKLMHFGYRNLSVLAGGVEAWKRAGYELFSGVHVPSKAFGEFVEQHERTPNLEASDVEALVSHGADLVILDARPMSEFHRMSITGAIDCPGAELIYRFHDIVSSPDTLVVVNCAGRTRSIIGAQSLINADVRNRVVALKNGTMGWHLSGFALDHGQSRSASAPSTQGLRRARAAAKRVARRFGVRSISDSEFTRMQGDADRRTLYLLDVRSPEEYLAGHLAGARSAPGGQLVQATDEYVGVRNARLVLVDSDGVRATMTASWLIQMGWKEIYVLGGDMSNRDLVVGPGGHLVLGLGEAAPNSVDAATLAGALEEKSAAVIDLNSSLGYRDAHIPGAWFAVRSRLDTALTKLPTSGMLVFTSPDGVAARLAAPEMVDHTDRMVRVLEGGTKAWIDAGLEVSSGMENLASEPDDVWYRPYDRVDGIESAMREYLNWEVDLMVQIERDGDAGFSSFPR